MDKLVALLKAVFLQQHEIVYNVMMMIMAVIVLVLVNWLKKAYKILETGTLPPADNKKYVKEISEAKNVSANLQRKVDELSVKMDSWDAHISALQEMKENLKVVKSEKSGLSKEILFKMEEEHKELFANLNKRIEDLYDKTRRFHEHLMNNQNQLNDLLKNINTLKDVVQGLDRAVRNENLPDFDKFSHSLDEVTQNMTKVNAEVEHLHNKILEHEDQLNDLKHIFEDMDATFAEMNKRFQKLEIT